MKWAWRQLLLILSRGLLGSLTAFQFLASYDIDSKYLLTGTTIILDGSSRRWLVSTINLSTFITVPDLHMLINGHPRNWRDWGSIPGLGRSLGERKGYPLQYSGREKSVDRVVHGVAKSWTRWATLPFTFTSVRSYLTCKIYLWSVPDLLFCGILVSVGVF